MEENVCSKGLKQKLKDLNQGQRSRNAVGCKNLHDIKHILINDTTYNADFIESLFHFASLLWKVCSS